MKLRPPSLSRFDDAERGFAQLDAIGGALQEFMPKGVDVAAMASKLRAFLEMQRRQREDQRRMQEQLEQMASEQADMRTQYAETIALIKGQMQASEEQKRENDAQIARMKEESERAAEVRARARARALGERGNGARARATPSRFL